MLLLHVEDGLLQHFAGVFDLIECVVDIGANEVADSFEQTHKSFSCGRKLLRVDSLIASRGCCVACGPVPQSPLIRFHNDFGEFSMSQLRLGGYIDAWCSKCKLMLGHTIQRIDDGVVKNVQCDTCKAEHQYKANPPNPPQQAPANPRRVKAKVAQQFAKLTARSRRMQMQNPPKLPKPQSSQGDNGWYCKERHQICRQSSRRDSCRSRIYPLDEWTRHVGSPHIQPPQLVQ